MNAKEGTSPGKSTDLLRMVPEIHRARGWRLYTRNGGRLVDLWQNGGRALLGHNPPGLLRTVKNSAQRGLFAPLPHFAEGRFLKALNTLFALSAGGPLAFRVYAGVWPLREALSSAGIPGGACSGRAQTGCPLWRPFLEPPPLPLFRPVLPLSFPGAPEVLAFDPAYGDRFPPSQRLSPIVLGAAARAVYDLIAAKNRGNPVYPKIERALKKNPLWKRRGIYLFPLGENYNALFSAFLEGGFLLPPGAEENQDPAILPGELSPGEEAKLAKLLRGS